MTTYHLPPEELKQAAENDSPSKRDQQCFILGSTHTVQPIFPTLDKALEALESVQWIDVKDRLPEEVDDFNSADAWVKCRTKNGAVLLSLCRYDYKSKKWFNGFNSVEENRITHWMPLPDTAKITEAINEIKKLKG